MGLAVNKEARQARRLNALDLRLSGLPIKEIATSLKISPSTAHSDLNVVLGDLAEQHSAGAAQLRAVQSARYESLLCEIWGKAKGGDLAAIDRCVSLLTRLDKINGIDNSESIALLVNQQVVNQTNVEPITPQQLEEYANVIREIASRREDAIAEAGTLPASSGNGHRESFKI